MEPQKDEKETGRELYINATSIKPMAKYGKKREIAEKCRHSEYMKCAKNQKIL